MTAANTGETPALAQHESKYSGTGRAELRIMLLRGVGWLVFCFLEIGSSVHPRLVLNHSPSLSASKVLGSQ